MNSKGKKIGVRLCGHECYKCMDLRRTSFQENGEAISQDELNKKRKEDRALDVKWTTTAPQPFWLKIGNFSISYPLGSGLAG